MSRRHNGGGSIYPVKDGYRGYVWCTSPAGEPYRKYVQRKTFEDARDEWFKRPIPEPEPAFELGGRYWDRTSDLLGVN